MNYRFFHFEIQYNMYTYTYIYEWIRHTTLSQMLKVQQIKMVYLHWYLLQAMKTLIRLPLTTIQFKSYEHFSERPRPAKMMLREASSPVCTPGWTMFKCISMQNLIQIYHVVQELWALSLTDHDQTNWCLTKPRPSKKAVTRASGSTMLTCIRMRNLIKVYYVVQELWGFPLTSNGRTDSHSD